MDRKSKTAVFALVSAVAMSMPLHSVQWQTTMVSHPASTDVLCWTRVSRQARLFAGVPRGRMISAHRRPRVDMVSRPSSSQGSGDDVMVSRPSSSQGSGDDIEQFDDIGLDAEPQQVFDSSSIQVLEEVTFIPSKLGIVAQWLQTLVTGSKEPLYTAPAPKGLIPMTGTLPALLNVTESSFLPGGRISSITALPTAVSINDGGRSDLKKTPMADAVDRKDDASGSGTQEDGSSSCSTDTYQPQRNQELKSSLPRDLWRIKVGVR